jgi:hypothetical protein
VARAREKSKPATQSRKTKAKQKAKLKPAKPAHKAKIAKPKPAKRAPTPQPQAAVIETAAATVIESADQVQQQAPEPQTGGTAEQVHEPKNIDIGANLTGNGDLHAKTKLHDDYMRELADPHVQWQGDKLAPVLMEFLSPDGDLLEPRLSRTDFVHKVQGRQKDRGETHVASERTIFRKLDELQEKLRRR